MTAENPDDFPERLGRYEVLLPIASGGMARVFLACSTAMGGFEREVAVKITHEHLKDNLQFVTALIDEARLAGRIRHPNVVSVLDVGNAPNGVFIVMDYVEGMSLAGLRQQLSASGAGLPVDIALRILDDVLSGLHAAHELTDAEGLPLEVVHRDATPSNVLVGIDGVSRITDFGVAKAASRLTKTVTGMVKGKIAYMAPEQARTGPLDRTCDVWAAGVMAWELLSGLRLHEGLNDFALMLKVTREPPPRLRHVRPDLPLSLDEAVAGALAMSPADRYPTAEVFAEALAAAARTAGIAPAGARGVKAFVTPLLLGLIEARREQAKRIRRARFGRSSSGLEPATPIRSRPSSERPSSPTPVPGGPLPSEPRGPLSSEPRVLDPTVTEALGPSTARAPDQTELVSAVSGSVRPGRRRRSWLVLALSVTLLVVCSVAVFVALRPPPAQQPTQLGASGTLPASSAEPPTPVLTPSQLPVEDEPDGAAISPDDLRLERKTKPGNRQLPPVPSPRESPALSPTHPQPEPLANPYKR